MATRNHRENCGICHAITCEHTRAARAIQEAVNLLNQPTQDHPPPDPRDAEIERLKVELQSTRDAWAEKFNAQAALVDRLRAALAAGPAALRELAATGQIAAAIVEAAQEAAMKEGM